MPGDRRRSSPAPFGNDRMNIQLGSLPPLSSSNNIHRSPVSRTSGVSSTSGSIVGQRKQSVMFNRRASLAIRSENNGMGSFHNTSNGRESPTASGLNRPSFAASSGLNQELRSKTGSLSSMVGANGQQPASHWVTLTFSDAVTEMEYNDFFLSKSLKSWRRILLMGLVLFTLYYAKVMIAAPFTETQSQEDQKLRDESLTECPPGWYCSKCPLDTLACTVGYSFVTDVCFMLVGIMLPIAFVYAITVSPSKRMMSILARHIHNITILLICHICTIMIVRDIVVEDLTNPLGTGIAFIMIIVGTHIFAKVRFFAALISCTYTTIMFLTLGLVHYLVTKGTSIDNRYIQSFICILLAMGVTVFTTYNLEIFSRTQFLRARQLIKTNKKLMDQLNKLRKDYNSKAADVESPLEKATELLRSLIADPAMSEVHINYLSSVLHILLHSSNLLVPNFEDHVKEGQVVVDRQQEEWLFDQVAMRRQPQRSNRSKRSPGDDGPPTESTLPSINPINASPSPTPEPTTIGTTVMNATSLTITNVNNEITIVSPPTITSPTISVTPSSHNSSGAISPDFSNGKHELQFINTMYAENRIKKLTLLREEDDPAPRMDVARDPDLPALSTARPDRIAKLNALMETIYDWNFHIFDLEFLSNMHPLVIMAQTIFEKEGLFAAFGINVEKFFNFVCAIEAGYHSDIPYHTATHAADVLHATYHFTNCQALRSVMTDLDRLALYFAAIVHDYDHPGINNNFLVNTQGAKAILYNDKSVLENHHLAAAFTIMSERQDHNFLSSLSKADFKSFRESVIEMVLATDLAQHFALLTLFRNKVTRGDTFDPIESREDKLLMLEMTIKCADVSNPTKAWPIHSVWVKRVLAEFFFQGDQERKLGLTISPLMDRDKIDIPSSQIGFMKFICSPLFDAFHLYADIPVVVDGLHSNYETWERRSEEAKLTEEAQRRTIPNTSLGKLPNTNSLTSLQLPPSSTGPSPVATPLEGRSAMALALEQQQQQGGPSASPSNQNLNASFTVATMDRGGRGSNGDTTPRADASLGSDVNTNNHHSSNSSSERLGRHQRTESSRSKVGGSQV